MVKSVIGLFILFILGVGLFFVVSTNLFVVALASTDVNETPKPSVPEFTFKYVDYSYDVPPVYGIDQFTGEEVITEEGYRVHERSIEFKIKNQVFTAYNDSSGNEINLYFNFRCKGHFGSEWSYYPFSENGLTVYRISFFSPPHEPPKSQTSNSEYTNITYRLGLLFRSDVPRNGSQVDFQVQALIGYTTSTGDGYGKFIGQRSDWSETQTETIPEFPSWIIIPLFIIATVVVIIYRNSLRRQVC